VNDVLQLNIHVQNNGAFSVSASDLLPVRLAVSFKVSGIEKNKIKM
jgi:hypothetical protein